MIIGLTGGLATGKSSVARMFGRHGAKIIDADQIAHELLTKKSIIKKITKKFGKEILEKGQISRGQLAQIVFKNPQKLRQLENIIHPEVRKETKKRIKKYKNQTSKAIVILDVPLLFEAGVDELADTTIVVKAPLQTQIKRAQKKWSITKTQALARIRSQMPLKDKIRRADIIIDNSGTLLQTHKEVNNVWQRLLQRQRS